MLDAALIETVYLLADDMGLPVKNADRPLCGEWADYPDCHIRPDLILIYHKPDEKYLDLVRRLGSHAELGF